MSEVGVKSLTIKVGARKICLDIAEAKKLKAALEDLFGKEVIREVHVERRLDPYWKWYGPVWFSGDTAGAKFKSPWGYATCTNSGQLSVDVK